MSFMSSPTSGTLDSAGVLLCYRDMLEVMDAPLPHTIEYSRLCLLAIEEPASVEAALTEPAWKKVTQEETNSILDNHTWEMSSLPPGHHAIRLKWVFKVKNDPAGNMVKHKARLVAKGTSNARSLTMKRSSCL